MNDKTKTSVDPVLETNQMVLEAFEISTTECAGVVNDSNSLECVAKNFEHYVQHYQDTWQTAWLDTISEYEKEVEGWQSAVSIFQAQTQALAQSQGNQAAASKSTTKAKKAKPASTTAKTPSKPAFGENE